MNSRITADEWKVIRFALGQLSPKRIEDWELDRYEEGEDKAQFLYNLIEKAELRYLVTQEGN